MVGSVKHISVKSTVDAFGSFQQQFQACNLRAAKYSAYRSAEFTVAIGNTNCILFVICQKAY